MAKTESNADAIVALNLPVQQVELRREGSTVEVYDPLRRQWLVLTPEEWVRQNFTSWLISDKGYPRSLMANEVGLRLNGMLRRCDTLVYDRTLRPLIVAEYKAPDVAITAAVFDQVARYNMVLRARLLIVSNGLRHFCCRYTADGYEFLRDIPNFADLS